MLPLTLPHDAPSCPMLAPIHYTLPLRYTELIDAISPMLSMPYAYALPNAPIKHGPSCRTVGHAHM
jgi:hypothetical protein